jgi:hypothetical protein
MFHNHLAPTFSFWLILSALFSPDIIAGQRNGYSAVRLKNICSYESC